MYPLHDRIVHGFTGRWLASALTPNRYVLDYLPPCSSLPRESTPDPYAKTLLSSRASMFSNTFLSVLLWDTFRFEEAHSKLFRR
jgi:hypothetical protein